MDTHVETKATVSEIWSLLDRVREARGPDKDIDIQLTALTYERGLRDIGTQANSGAGGRWVPVQDDVWIDPTTDKWARTAPSGFEYTASLDQALRFVERLFPASEWKVGKTGAGEGWGLVRLHALLWVQEKAASPALGLIAACLRAMILRGDGGRS